MAPERQPNRWVTSKTASAHLHGCSATHRAGAQIARTVILISLSMRILDVLFVNRFLVSGMLLHRIDFRCARSDPCNRPRTHLIILDVAHGVLVVVARPSTMLFSMPDNIVVIDCTSKVADQVLEQYTA